MTDLALRELRAVVPRNVIEWRIQLVDLLSAALAAYLSETERSVSEPGGEPADDEPLMSAATRGNG